VCILEAIFLRDAIKKSEKNFEQIATGRKHNEEPKGGEKRGWIQFLWPDACTMIKVKKIIASA